MDWDKGLSILASVTSLITLVFTILIGWDVATRFDRNLSWATNWWSRDSCPENEKMTVSSGPAAPSVSAIAFRIPFKSACWSISNLARKAGTDSKKN